MHTRLVKATVQLNHVSNTSNHPAKSTYSITSQPFILAGVDKSSTNLPGWGEGGTVTSVGWQITLFDPIDKWRPVVLR